MLGSIAVLLIFCAGFAFFSTELTSEDSYRTEVESVEGQNLLNESFPAGTTALDRHRRPGPGRGAGGADGRSPASTASRRSRSRWPAGRRGPWCRRRWSRTPTRPRPSTWSSRSATPRTEAAPGSAGRRPDGDRIRRPRRRRLGLDRDPADHPPRRLPDPDRPAAGRGRAAGPDRHGDPQLPRRPRRRLLRLRRRLRLPRLGPLAAALRLRLPGRARRRLQHLPRSPAPARRRSRTAPNRGSCAPSRSPAASSPAPASSSPAPSRCSPSCRSPSSPRSASSSPSASCSTPSWSAASSSPRSPSGSATASGGLGALERGRPAKTDDPELRAD